ncbi:hypothetical protein AX14_012871 [Amanita brunnescens Koide BX004]|nr:hypothetical protein AX14_012871 [Amanita brunnescens Koide BX004]
MPRLRRRSKLSGHSTPPLHAVESPCAAQYDGPISTTMSRMTPRSRAHTLPLEVLSMIFILALASDEQIVEESLSLWPPKWGNPLPLCAVSSLWRSVALATPQLWQRVSLHIPQHISKVWAESKAEALVPWIERSGSLPLILFIRYPSMSHQNESETSDSIVNVLNIYASRWETLYFRFGSQSFGRGWNPLALFRIDKWSSLQRLYTNVEPHETIPWAQLTHLMFCNDVSYTQVVDIFKRCPKLVWLSLSIHVAPEFFDVSASPIILHDLSSVFFTINNLSAIIQWISLPSLREISVSKVSPPATDLGSLKSLHSFLTRSSCTLDKLDMQGVIPPLPDDLVQILAHRSCDFLNSLTLCQSWLSHTLLINNEVLRRLTLHHDDSVCTHLKSLTLNCEALPALPDMVESRIGSHTSRLPEGALEMLHLRIKDFDPAQKVAEIIQRSGMECEIREPHIGTYSVWSVRLHR